MISEQVINLSKCLKNIKKAIAIKTEIKTVINQYPNGININDLANKIPHSKGTISKYVEELGHILDIFPVYFGNEIICFPNNQDGFFGIVKMFEFECENMLRKTKYSRIFSSILKNNQANEFFKKTIPKKERYDIEDLKQFIEAISPNKKIKIKL